MLTYFSLNQEEGPVDQIIDTLLRMLEKDVVDNSKSCAEYFEFFKNYASSVSTVCVVHVFECVWALPYHFIVNICTTAHIFYSL